MTTSWPMSDCARSGRMGAGRMMDGERADARGGEGARVPRSARGSRASSSRSGERRAGRTFGCAGFSADKLCEVGGGGGVRVSGRASGGEVGCRNARARAARAPFPASGARGNAPRARSRDPHRGARAGVAEAHLVSRRPAAALSSSAPDAGRARGRAAIARGVLGRVRRSPPFPERPRVPASVQTRRRARIEPPRAPPACPARSAASPGDRTRSARSSASHLAARGAECAGPARRFAEDFFTSGGGTGRSFGSCAGIGYRADSDECLAISSE